MAIREFDTVQDLQAWVGKEVALTEWLTVEQEHIDRFADATGDHQWIHVDVERSRKESPFRTTIAHGFLTLSLLSRLLGEAITFRQVRMGVNYGLNRVRFTAPVPAGGRVRGRFILKQLEEFNGGLQMTWDVTVELDGGHKPVLVAEWLTRRYI